jgi:hypothetical protein
VTAVVIDTNVLLVANGAHTGASSSCRAECIAQLVARQRAGIVVIDDAHRILGEYQRKTRPNQPRGVGDAFLKWLLQNKANSQRVHCVSLTESDDDHFAEFPDQALQPEFDPADRKFAAVANAHAQKPTIWQAADCKWLGWWQRLHVAGVNVEFLCPHDVQRFHKIKFPKQDVPGLPKRR